MDKQELYSLAEKAIDYANSLKIDYADIRLQHIDRNYFELKTKEFESTIAGSAFGIGVKVIHDGKLGFYSSNDPDIKKIVDTALHLAKLNPSTEKVKLALIQIVKDEIIIKAKKPLANYSIEDKREFAKSMVKSAQIDKKIKSINARYADSTQRYIFASTEGARIYQNYDRVRALAEIVGKKGKVIDTTFHADGGFGFEIFDGFTEVVKHNAEILLKILGKKQPPSGQYDVVLDSHNAGLFAHEAVGHACEGDQIIQKDSILIGKIGKKIGSYAANLSDSAVLPGKWGSYAYDDEGTQTQHTRLIERGILKTYMHSRETAAELGAKPTGNARAMNYACIPLVRMSNTIFEPGDYTFEELLKEIKNGYYLAGIGGGGTVSTLAGTFSFASGYAYKIKNGELKDIYRGCSFSGNILKTLPNIVAVGVDEDNISTGYCGKSDQHVPTGDGKSHVAIRKLYIGGS